MQKIEFIITCCHCEISNNKYSMEHQDWKPVILRKPQTKESLIKKGNYTIEKKQNLGNNKSFSDISARKLEQEEIPQLPKVSPALSAAISKGRTEKTLTRKDLARLCNLKESIIADYETGKAIPQTREIQIISKHLGVPLKKNME